MKTNNILMCIIGLSLIVLVLSVSSFAYFTANTGGGEKTSTVIVEGATLQIDYTEGSHIDVENAYPKEEAWVVKKFTVKGSNNTDLLMNYQAGLDVSTNTFPDGYLSYSVRNVVSEGGTPFDNMSLVPIKNGKHIITFGVGQFLKGSNVTHTYEISIFFKEKNENQNVAQDADFSAKIIFREAGTYKDKRLMPWETI